MLVLIISAELLHADVLCDFIRQTNLMDELKAPKRLIAACRMADLIILHGLKTLARSPPWYIGLLIRAPLRSRDSLSDRVFIRSRSHAFSFGVEEVFQAIQNRTCPVEIAYQFRHFC